MEENLKDPSKAARFQQLPVILRVCADVLAGLAHMHKHRCWHRDLATRNVLLDTNLRAKLTDFGLTLHQPQSQAVMHELLDPVPWQFEVVLAARLARVHFDPRRRLRLESGAATALPATSTASLVSSGEHCNLVQTFESLSRCLQGVCDARAQK